nr:hypothetical protein CFP56_19571 [Quercus suber]
MAEDDGLAYILTLEQARDASVPRQVRDLTLFGRCCFSSFNTDLAARSPIGRPSQGARVDQVFVHQEPDHCAETRDEERTNGSATTFASRAPETRSERRWSATHTIQVGVGTDRGADDGHDMVQSETHIAASQAVYEMFLFDVHQPTVPTSRTSLHFHRVQ